MANAWKIFFDKAQHDLGKPRFKSKKSPRQGFKTDRVKVVNGKLRLDKPRGIKNWFDILTYEALKIKQIKITSIFKENSHSDNDRYIGIDPVVDNAFACVSNTEHQPILIKDRNLKSINQYYNKERSRLRKL